MTDGPETLASLVAAAVDNDGLTFVQLSERSVDPKSGYKPSPNVLWKVARQKGVKVNEQLVAAIAAGLRLPPVRVQAAAAYEFTGLVVVEVDGGNVVREAGIEGPASAKSRAAVADWDREESPDEGNHRGS